MSVYCIELEDGRVVYAGEEHPFEVLYKSGRKYQSSIMTTMEILEDLNPLEGSSATLFFENCLAVDYLDKNIPLNAYTMGLWLPKAEINLSIPNSIKVFLPYSE